jgi:hypothetical protein
VGVAGVLAVLLLLYTGWWELGRAPSLNPLETGLAMGAPLLLLQSPTTTTTTAATAGPDGGGSCSTCGGGMAAVNSNAGHAHIVARLGARRVRYGAVPVQEGGRGETEYIDDDDLGEPLHSETDDTAYAALREQEQPLPLGDAGGGQISGAGGRMRLRLVDVDEARKHGVTVLTPMKGDKFD